MGAKTWMLVYATADVAATLRREPELDRDATLTLAQELFPGDTLEPIGDGDLSYTCPRRNEIHVGCFPGVSIVAADEFLIDYPSKLPARFIAAGSSGTVYFHAMHSVVDWFAFAQWTNGTLVRSLSLSPDNGVMEDIGPRLAFEEPYWAGDHPVHADAFEDEKAAAAYPLPFHPLDLGEAALKALFGYQLEGLIDPALLDPESIPLVVYKRPRLSLTAMLVAIARFFGGQPRRIN